MSQLPTLSFLSAGSNAISDLSPLSTLTKLRGVLLDANLITDLQPLAGLPELTSIDLSGNQISNLSPLSQVQCTKDCCTLDVTDNPLDAASLDQLIPSLCDASMAVSWTTGSCAPCPINK